MQMYLNLIDILCDRVCERLFLVSFSIKRTLILKMYFLIEIIEQIDWLIWNGLGIKKKKQKKKTRNIFRTVWGKLYGASESPQNSESNQDKKHGTAERNHMHSQAHGANKAQVSWGWSIIGTRNSDYEPRKTQLTLVVKLEVCHLNLCVSYIK